MAGLSLSRPSCSRNGCGRKRREASVGVSSWGISRPFAPGLAANLLRTLTDDAPALGVCDAEPVEHHLGGCPFGRDARLQSVPSKGPGWVSVPAHWTSGVRQDDEAVHGYPRSSAQSVIRTGRLRVFSIAPVRLSPAPMSRVSVLRRKLRSRFCCGAALMPPFLPAVLLHGLHELEVCICDVDRAAAGLDEVGAVILARGTAPSRYVWMSTLPRSSRPPRRRIS